MNDEKTVKPHGRAASSNDRGTNRSGRAISSPTPVNTAVSPSGGPSSADCYTTLLHNPDDDLGTSSGKLSGKQPGGCCSGRKRTHSVPLSPTGQNDEEPSPKGSHSLRDISNSGGLREGLHDTC